MAWADTGESAIRLAKTTGAQALAAIAVGSLLERRSRSSHAVFRGRSD